MRRALGNALATNIIERDGRVPIVTSANGLQPDKQNDNGWDQGLLFLNPSKVWLQPPGYVTQMLSRNYLPQVVKREVVAADGLDVTAKRSEDGARLQLQVVNLSDKPVTTTIRLAGFTPKQPAAKVIELAGPLDARNTRRRPKLSCLRKLSGRTEWRRASRRAHSRPTRSRSFASNRTGKD